MSHASYNHTVTRSARLALALKREWTREHFHSFNVIELPLQATPVSVREAFVETLPDFGVWAVAYVNDAVHFAPVSERVRVLNVPGAYARRLVEHKYCY